MYGWEESLLMTGGIVTKMEIRKNFKDRDKLFVYNNDEIKKGEQFLIFSREIYTKKVLLEDTNSMKVSKMT